MVPEPLILERMSRHSNKEHDECSEKRQQNDTFYLAQFPLKFSGFLRTEPQVLLKQGTASRTAGSVMADLLEVTE